jgi:hypothetical protein
MRSVNGSWLRAFLSSRMRLNTWEISHTARSGACGFFSVRLLMLTLA